MIYEYTCRAGHTFEAQAKLADAHLPSLCDCGELGKRILSPTRTTFVFADTRKRIRHIQKLAARQ